MGGTIQKVALLSLRSVRFAIVFMLEPLGKRRRDVFEILLYGLVRPIWNLLPNMSNFTYVASVGVNKIRFRPLVMHDFLFVLANASKNHEPLVQEVFQPKPGEVVVDVGAHIGLYTLRAARDVGANGKVIAVEPDPQSYRILKDNIALNYLENVTAINAALSDTSGQKKFYACTDPSLSGFELQPEGRLREVAVVKVMSLDELLQAAGLSEVDWMKIDVEGAELKVLQGGKRLLKDSKNLRIIIESSKNQAMEYLNRFGFRTRHLGEIYYFAEKTKT
jgi:FkbM family methyltransferase